MVPLVPVPLVPMGPPIMFHSGMAPPPPNPYGFGGIVYPGPMMPGPMPIFMQQSGGELRAAAELTALHTLGGGGWDFTVRFHARGPSKHAWGRGLE